MVREADVKTGGERSTEGRKVGEEKEGTEGGQRAEWRRGRGGEGLCKHLSVREDWRLLVASGEGEEGKRGQLSSQRAR